MPIQKAAPTTRPPKKLETRPTYETPPLVPLGTVLPVVMRNGSPLDNHDPISEAQVSPEMNIVINHFVLPWWP